MANKTQTLVGKALSGFRLSFTHQYNDKYFVIPEDLRKWVQFDLPVPKVKGPLESTYSVVSLCLDTNSLLVTDVLTGSSNCKHGDLVLFVKYAQVLICTGSNKPTEIKMDTQVRYEIPAESKLAMDAVCDFMPCWETYIRETDVPIGVIC